VLVSAGGVSHTWRCKCVCCVCKWLCSRNTAINVGLYACHVCKCGCGCSLTRSHIPVSFCREDLGTVTPSGNEDPPAPIS
jgi:hypothetical protein